MKTTLRVNDTVRTIDVDEDTPLLWVLRDELSMTGTKFGCGRAQCGACTVYVDGEPRRSCVMAVKHVGDRPVTTIEGLDGGVADRVQEAWNTLQVPQCGFCQSGQVMTAVALLSEIPNPTDEQIDAAMAGNICRCATYDRIRQAIHKAAGAPTSGRPAPGGAS